MFFIGQNLKHVRMTYSVLELLIFFWLAVADIYFLEFISHHVKEILYVNEYKLHGKPIINIFTSFW